MTKSKGYESLPEASKKIFDDSNYMYYTYEKYMEHRNSIPGPGQKPSIKPRPTNNGENTIGGILDVMLEQYGVHKPGFKEEIRGYITSKDSKKKFHDNVALQGGPSVNIRKTDSALAESVGLFNFVLNNLGKNLQTTFTGTKTVPLPEGYEYINLGGRKVDKRTALTDSTIEIVGEDNGNTLNVSVKWFEKNAIRLQALGSVTPGQLHQAAGFGIDSNVLQNFANYLAVQGADGSEGDGQAYQTYFLTKLIGPLTFGISQGDQIDVFMTQDGFISAADYLEDLWKKAFSGEIFYGASASNAAAAVSKTYSFLRYKEKAESSTPLNARVLRSKDTWNRFLRQTFKVFYK